MTGATLRRLRAERNARGAAAVEFALIVPFLCILLFGIISYGIMLSFRQTLSQATAEGARAAAVTYLTDNKRTAAYDAITEAMESYGLKCESGVLKKGAATVGSCVVTDPAVGTCTPATAGIKCVKVTISYDYEDHGVGPSFPGLGIVLPDDLTYSAQARIS